MRKITALLLSLILMAGGLSACGPNNPASQPSSGSASQTTGSSSSGGGTTVKGEVSSDTPSPPASSTASGPASAPESSPPISSAPVSSAPEGPADPTYGVNVMDFSIPQPSGVYKTVDAAQFGLSTASSDNTRAFLAAAAYLTANPGTKLSIKKGVYYFDPGNRITLSKIRNCIIEGNGAEFIFTDGYYFNISQCDTLLIQNLTVDWDWEKGNRLASLIRVKSVSGKTVVFEFMETDDASYAVSTPWETLNQYDAVSLTPGCEGGVEYWGLASGVSNKTHLGGNLVSAQFNAGNVSHFQAGQVYLLRHYTYRSSVFYTGDNSKNISYKNIRIYAAYGSGFVAGGGASHMLFSGITIGLRPGTEKRYRISTTVDAFHIADTAGYFIMENCDVSFQGDDCLNVHDNIGVVESVSGKTITVACKATGNYNVGAELTFKNASTYVDYGVKAVVTAKNVGSGRVTLTLDREVNGLLKGAVVSDNSRNSSNYIVRNNYFHECRARGLLLGSSNGLVENNRFYKTQGAAILIPIDIADSWMEGTGVDNLLIRNNTFDTCNVNDWTALIEFVANNSGRSINGECFTKIAIVNNTMIDFPSRMLLVHGVRDVTVAGNTIKNPTAMKGNLRGVIEAEYFKNLTISDNTWHRSSHMADDVNEVQLTERNPDKTQITLKNNVLK